MSAILPRLSLSLALLLPSAALAVGPDDTPPTPTETTTTCAEGLVWDAALGQCVAIQDSRLDDDALYGAARELAYAGRYDDAIAVLGRMSDPGQSRVLTYLGFAHRRAGRVDEGMAYYDQALAADPGNLLARSYMGQAHVIAGRYNLARQQLDEIRARGGAGGWPEIALVQAIATGQTSDY